MLTSPFRSLSLSRSPTFSWLGFFALAKNNSELNKFHVHFYTVWSNSHFTFLIRPNLFLYQEIPFCLPVQWYANQWKFDKTNAQNNKNKHKQANRKRQQCRLLLFCLRPNGIFVPFFFSLSLFNHLN